MIKIWNWFERKLWIILSIIVLGLILMFANGCVEYVQRDLSNDVELVQSKVADVAQAIAKVEYGTNETINLLKAAQKGNEASASFNPYALPIGAGLAGVIAMLEALRRKEKGGRKYAEHELSNNKNNNNTS